MNKTVLIYSPGASYTNFWDVDSNSEGLGGTESMICSLAKHLSKVGYVVTLVCNPENSHVSSTGVRCITKESIELNICFFDFGIFYFSDDAKRMKQNCGKIFLFPSCEPVQRNREEEISGYDEIDYVHKIVCLSEFHKKYITSKHGIPENKIVLIPNGFDWYEYYEDVNNDEKTISMLWSSRYERNFEFFMDKVFPKVKKYYPHFKIYFASYNDEYFKKAEEKYGNEIEILGKLSKKELAEYQKKCCIWAYPNLGINFYNVNEDLWDNFVFHETFCYTALENALAGNAIICFGNDKDGISTTLKNGKFIHSSVFDEYSYFYNEDLEAVANLMAAEIVRCLSYKDTLVKHTFSRTDPIWNEYRWENVIKQWIKMLEDE